MTAEEKLLESLGIPAELKQKKIGSHTINYLVAGSGPPLLLIHGGNIGWGQWYPNIPSFAKNFTVYAIDLPGSGHSSALDYAHLDPERDFVAVVEDFIKSTGIQPSVIGASLGGWIALRLAALHDPLVKKLVLVDSVGFLTKPTQVDRILSFRPLVSFLTRYIFKPLRSNPRIEQMIRTAFFDKKTSLPKVFVDYFYEVTARAHHFWFIHSLTERFAQFVLSEEIFTLPNRILVVWGKQDKMIPFHLVVARIEKLRHKELAILNNAGHFPSMEQASIFNTKTTRFL